MTAYIHCNGDKSFKRGTIAIELPAKDDLINLFMQHGTCMALIIGAARLAKKKVFNKKLGREYATQMMIPAKADLTEVEIRGTKHVYHFVAWLPNNCPDERKVQCIKFGLSTTLESNNVAVMYGFFSEDDL